MGYILPRHAELFPVFIPAFANDPRFDTRIRLRFPGSSYHPLNPVLWSFYTKRLFSNGNASRLPTFLQSSP